MKIKKMGLSALVAVVVFGAFAADVGVAVNGKDVSAGAGGRFLKEVDGLKSSNSRFFRLDFRWKASSRP